MYFRSLVPFMALVFATSAFAAPAIPSRSLTAPVDNAAASIPVVDIAKKGGNTASELLPRQVPLHVIFQEASDKITPVVGQLKTNIANKASIDAATVTQNLQDIKAALTSLLGELTSFAKNPVSVVQPLLSLTEIVEIVAPLIQLLFTVLALVLTVVNAIPLRPILQPIVAEITVLLGKILCLVVSIVPGLLAELLPLLTALLPTLQILDIQSVLTLLGL